MSLVSTAYDSIVTLVTTTLNDYYRLINTEDESKNLDIFLRKGWCLVVNDEQNTNRHLCNITTYKRRYSLILSNEFYGLDGDYRTQDESIKGLLEDVELINDAIYKQPNIGNNEGLIISSETSSRVDFVDKDNRKFILSTIFIEIERFKQL